ncbi:hypothetical protein J4050_05125 [Winogradskyella sp. DF17]|uniref:Uncharacterized protein n=1 Tax=Winogradskyella pelagia TaxID=2819984 RepID=A0ABS3T047_9FLAO|nr:hypothetical protein [Winogradskyella sp. DF17]MBO3116117.1 hypothetical protein [Winogradskyella sp. DF17]
MIKFFRKIRYNLMETGKTTKYFKYAVGEIVLVMIGILLALQVNNGNQNRIENNEEKEVIAKLHTDFKENKGALKKYMIRNRQEMDALNLLINLAGASKDQLSKHNLDSLLYESLSANDIAFADNTLKNVMQSGKLNLIKDDSITQLLYQWNALGEIRKERFYRLERWANEEFVPYLLNKISFREMDAQIKLKWTGKSKLKPDYYIVFNELAFENHLDNMLWYHHQVKERCEETNVLIDKIIEATKP